MSATVTPQKVVEELARSIDVMFAEARAAMTEATKLTHDRVSELAPRGRTLKLSTDIAVSVRETQTSISGNVHPRAYYGGLVEGGTGLYADHHARITPTSRHLLSAGATKFTPKENRLRDTAGKAALKFSGRGGAIFFRGSVRGQRAQPFVVRAKTEVEPRVLEILEAGATTAAEKLFR